MDGKNKRRQRHACSARSTGTRQANPLFRKQERQAAAVDDDEIPWWLKQTLKEMNLKVVPAAASDIVIDINQATTARAAGGGRDQAPRA